MLTRTYSYFIYKYTVIFFSMKVIPASDIKRVNIQLSLQGETFSKTLEDKSSEAHKILKKKVTVAVRVVIQ